jgi:hypothetical protein
VNIIEEWEDFAKYAHDKVGFYQILGVDRNIEVRIATGKAGYIRVQRPQRRVAHEDLGILREGKKLPKSRRNSQRRSLLQITLSEATP